MVKLLTSLKRKLSFSFGKSDFLLLKTEYVGSKKENIFFIDRITHVKTRHDNIKVLHHKEQASDIETLSIPEDMKSDLILKGSHYSTYSVH